MQPKFSGPELATARSYEIVARRVLYAPRHIRRLFTSALKIKSQIWLDEFGALLLIDDDNGILKATKRRKKDGELFPFLLAKKSGNSIFVSKDNVRNFSISGPTLDANGGYVAEVEPDCGFVLNHVRIKSHDITYEILGTLIYIKFGAYYFEENFDDAFDEMIAFFADRGSRP